MKLLCSILLLFRVRAVEDVVEAPRRQLSISPDAASPEVAGVYERFEATLAESPSTDSRKAFKALVTLWKGLGHRAPAAAKDLGIPKLEYFDVGFLDRSAVDADAVNRAVSEFQFAWSKGTDSRALLETAVALGLQIWETSLSGGNRKLTFGHTCRAPDYRALAGNPSWNDYESGHSIRYICIDFKKVVPQCCRQSQELVPDSCNNCELPVGGKTIDPDTEITSLPILAGEENEKSYWANGMGDECCDDSDCCDNYNNEGGQQGNEQNDYCREGPGCDSDPVWDPFGGCECYLPTSCIAGQCVNPNCHPAASKLLLADGSSAPISEVELGALVASPSGPKPIVALLHSDPDAVGSYVRLTTASGAAIEISPLHLLPVNGKLTDPADVAVGAMLQTPRGPEAVVRVDKIKAAGAFHVVVEGGQYYVDGVLSSDHYDKFPVSVWPLVRASMTRRYQLGIPVVPLERGLFSLDWPWQLMTRLGVPATVQRDVLFPVTLPLAFFTSLANSVYAAAFEPSAKPAASAPSWAGNHSTGAYKHALFAGVGVKDVSRAGL